MRIGLYDVDSHNYPNLALMKISAWHKQQGDTVEWINFLEHYDKVYVSKVFSDEYSVMDNTCINADEIVFGGTGFAITIEGGREVYHKDRDKDLPYEIEHTYPDYDLYPDLTKNKAIGFLTRGCCNHCSFCIVSDKEGCASHKTADLNEFWHGQKYIDILDPNILACKERIDLLQQLVDSNAKVNFNQGLDARFFTEEVAYKLLEMKDRIVCIHFAFDFMKNEKAIVKGLKLAHDVLGLSDRQATVYMLTNYDTTFEEDYRRIKLIQECGFQPDVRIYRKKTAPKITRHLQTWCNGRITYRSTDFWNFSPSKKPDGIKIKDLFPNEYKLYGEKENE